MAVVLVLLSTGLSSPAAAFTDDMEDDFWQPFTHFHLGTRAVAGYSDALARSGLRSFHVAIMGWAVRDFGTAFGYAIYSTHGAPLTELRLSLYYESLSDTIPSPWDAFSAGVGLDLLDADYRVLGSVRYLTAYRASANAGRCGPTPEDIVLSRAPELGRWTDLGRSPSSDFPSVPWGAAAFVRVSVGFLCAAGLSGAAYSLYFDDFTLESSVGDSDGDGLSDLEEETRLYSIEVVDGSMPLAFSPYGNITTEIAVPSAAAPPVAEAVSLAVSSTDPSSLSVSLELGSPRSTASWLLWDPGFRARRIAILRPAEHEVVRGNVTVCGRSDSRLPGTVARLYVDGVWAANGQRLSDGAFSVPWDSDEATQGSHSLQVQVTDERGEARSRLIAPEVSVIVDRSPPDVRIASPAPGSTVRGLVPLQVQAFDGNGLASVSLWIDGLPFETRESEPYTFVYDTLDVPNGAHVFEARAVDRAGNEGRTSVALGVNNQASAPPPPCVPTCSLSAGTTSGNLPPSAFVAKGYGIVLADGNPLRGSESLRVPWTPGLLRSPGGVTLILQVAGTARSPSTDEVLVPSIPDSVLANAAVWRIVVQDHGSGAGGVVERVSLLQAFRTSSTLFDTDGDGIGDGAERTIGRTLPVLRDSDDDGLNDRFEMTPQPLSLVVDGRSATKTVYLDPTRGDMDGDGLGDGRELFPGPEGNVTDPTNPDTDADGASDGDERDLYGSDPTRTDTDRDSLLDGYEVTPRELTLWVNGTIATWTYTTSPILADTDRDGVNDPSEEGGRNPLGLVTHPALADTDADGLSDGEELAVGVDGFVTSPVDADTDADGVWDIFDRLPRSETSLDWRTVHPPGLIRFDQTFLAFSIRGTQAVKYVRVDDWVAGTHRCDIVSNDVAGSTKSSVVNEDTVVSAINTMFRDGEETRFQATVARPGDPASASTSAYPRWIGSCGEDLEAFYIEYMIDRAAYEVSFVNVEDVVLRDERDEAFSYALMEIPLTPGRPESLIMEFSLPHGPNPFEAEGVSGWLTPGFSYTLYGAGDPLTRPVLFSGLAVATELNEDAYRVELRIPGNGLSWDHVEIRDGRRIANLSFSPRWVGVTGGNQVQRALSVTGLRVASMSIEQTTLAYSLIAPIDSNVTSVLEPLAEELAQSQNGYQVVQGLILYVFHAGEGTESDASAAEHADALLVVGTSEQALYDFRGTIDWGADGRWYRNTQDLFGNQVKAFRDSTRIVRASVTVGRYLDLFSFRFLGPGEYAVRGDPTNLITVEKGEFGGRSIYTVTTLESSRSFRFELSPSGEPVVRSQLSYQPRKSEIVEDVMQSEILGSRYAILKTGLRNLIVAGILVTDGYEAVTAFQRGDEVRGIVYAARGSLMTFAVYQSERTLATLLGLESARLGLMKLGAVFTVAAGAIFASYELGVAFQSSDEMSKRLHVERAIASCVDTAFLVVPGGAAVSLAWGLTTIAMSFLIPNSLAARITSSPGSTITFLMEYFFTTSIPADIANAVFGEATQVAILMVEENNRVLHLPSVPILP